MKDDSGAYAVFAEQGSSGSQMTAAEVMDVIATRIGPNPNENFGHDQDSAHKSGCVARKTYKRLLEC